MTKIPPDDILEGLCKLRIRESEKLKTVQELYDVEIHQKSPKIPVKLNSSLDRFGLDGFDHNRLGLITTCERWDLC